MTAKATPRRARLVRFDSLDAMPSAEPLSSEFKARPDADVQKRAANDPDAGTIPAGFWEGATPDLPENKEQVTLRLDPDVLRYFRALGRGYQSRINAVLRSYMVAKKAGESPTGGRGAR